MKKLTNDPRWSMTPDEAKKAEEEANGYSEEYEDGMREAERELTEMEDFEDDDLWDDEDGWWTEEDEDDYRMNDGNDLID